MSIYQKLLSREWERFRKAPMQPAWVTREGPEQHEEGPALSTQGKGDEGNKKGWEEAAASDTCDPGGGHVTFPKAQFWTYRNVSQPFCLCPPLGRGRL